MRAVKCICLLSPDNSSHHTNPYTGAYAQYHMSLTQLLGKPAVKKLFRGAFPFKPFDIDSDLAAPPVTTHYTAVGTAFDYLVRWWLGYKFPDAVERPWVAEEAVMRLAVSAGMIYVSYDGSTVRYRPASKAERESYRALSPKQCDSYAELHDAAVVRLNDSRESYNQYKNTGVATDDTFRAALTLAGLDSFYRSGHAGGIRARPNLDDMQDLRRLWGVLEGGGLRDLKGPVALNPEFGAATDMVRGADADVIAGDILIDIKTTKNGRFTTEYYHQLVGYWALSLVGGVDGLPNHNIDRLGVYFSRHGVLHTVPIPSIGSDALELFLAKFKRMANRYSRPALD